jgi:hypothetical protein
MFMDFGLFLIALLPVVMHCIRMTAAAAIPVRPRMVLITPIAARGQSGVTPDRCCLSRRPHPARGDALGRPFGMASARSGG